MSVEVCRWGVIACTRDGRGRRAGRVETSRVGDSEGENVHSSSFLG
jgi:hypothetical protein